MPSVNQEFWMNKFIATTRRYSRVLRKLHDLEWKTMIVWECQLEKDTIAAINRVANWLSQEKTAPNISFGTGSPRVNRKELIRASAEKVRSRTRDYSTGVLAASSGSFL
jgi:DNA mismatch endonuclease (patch repair protein)